MPKLRLKVKHIFLLLLLVGVLCWVQSFVFSQIVFTKGKNYLDNGEEVKGIAYLRKYIQKFPDNKKALKAFEEVLDRMPRTDNYLIFIGHGRSGGGIHTLAELENLKELNRDFVELNKHHNGEDILKLKLKLAKINYQANNVTKTRELLKEVASCNDKEYKKAGTILLTLLHLELGEVSKAQKLLERSSVNSIEVKKIKQWLNLIYKNKNNANYENVIMPPGNSFLYYRHSWAEKYFNDNLIKKIIKNEEGHEVNVKGYVRKGDIPLTNTIVFLQEKAYKGSRSLHTGPLEYTGDYITVTGEDGYYQFKNVEPGYYYMGVGIAYQRIKDYIYQYPEDITVKKDQVVVRDIHFQPTVTIIDAPEKRIINNYISFDLAWKPYPGAAYYKVYFGISYEGSTFFSLKGDKIFATNKTINITPEVFHNTGTSFDSKGISPGSVIGYNKVPCKILYTVYAYDENDNFLSKSVDPLKRYSFDWEGQDELNKGDKLLLERKYEEAIEVYEGLVSRGQADEHVLKALGRLYYHGYKYEGTNMVGRDYEKAHKYLTKAYNLGKDKSLLPILRSLSIRQGDWDLAEHYNEISLQQEPENGWLWLMKGRIELYQGNLEDAEQYLIKGIEKTGQRQEYLILTYLLQGRRQDALMVEDRYVDKDKRLNYARYLEECYKVLNWNKLEEFFRLTKSGYLGKAKKTLSPESETGKFYQALTLALQPRSIMKEDYFQTYQKLENAALKELIKILGKELISSSFPHRM